jgi:hypothetical protein
MGFHDTIKPYGLLESMITLNKTAITNNLCHARTAYRLTEPFMI